MAERKEAATTKDGGVGREPDRMCSKRPYSAPQLIVYGSVDQITHYTGTEPSDIDQTGSQPF